MQTRVANIAHIEETNQLRHEIRAELESFINNAKTYHSSHAQIPEVQKIPKAMFELRASSTSQFLKNSSNPDNISKQLFTSNKKTNQSNNFQSQQKFGESQYLEQQEIKFTPQRMPNSNFASQQLMKSIHDDSSLGKNIINNQLQQQSRDNYVINTSLNQNRENYIQQISPSQNVQNQTQMIVSPQRSHNHSPEKYKLDKCKKKVENLKDEIHDNKKSYEKRIENEVSRISNRMFSEKKLLEESLQKAEQKIKEFSQQEMKLYEAQEQTKLLQKEKIQIEKSKKKFKQLQEENMEMELKVQEQDRIIQMLSKQVKDFEKINKKGGLNDQSQKKEKGLTKKNTELIVQVNNLQLENKVNKEQNIELQNKIAKMKKKMKKLKFEKQNLKEELEMEKKTNILYQNKIGNKSKTVSVQYEKIKS